MLTSFFVKRGPAKFATKSFSIMNCVNDVFAVLMRMSSGFVRLCKAIRHNGEFTATYTMRGCSSAMIAVFSVAGG